MFDPSCIDVEDFLDCLDIRNVSRNSETEFQFSCPFPEHLYGDRNPSAFMNTETTAFICFSCHAKGNAVSFASQVLGVSPIEATRMLRQRYSSGGIDPSARSMVEEIRKILDRKEPEKRENRVLAESVLDAYQIDWQEAARKGEPYAKYMFETRGFRLESLLSWQFGYSKEHDRITLPIRDEHGRLVGIKARAWDHRKPKYLNLRDDENGVDPFLKNEIVFGLDRVIPFKPVITNLIIVEGEWNVVKMHDYGYISTVSVNGSYIGERQIRLIKQHAESVVLFFDSDNAGRDATETLVNALKHHVRVYICPDHQGDPADMHINSIRACLADKISVAQRAIMGCRSKLEPSEHQTTT